MEKRLDRFLFYRSYQEAAKYLTKSGDFEGYGRLMHVICSYVLDGEEPEAGFLPDAVMPLWIAFYPTLKVSRGKAVSGAKGGEISKGGGRPKKQAQNKHKTSEKQPIKNKVLSIKNKVLNNISSSNDDGVCLEDKDFALWWDAYDKKRSKKDTLKKWCKLTADERAKCLAVVDDYVRSTPDKSYRKDPLTYINQKSFNDEIINRTNGNNTRNDAITASTKNLARQICSTATSRTDVSHRLPFCK